MQKLPGVAEGRRSILHLMASACFLILLSVAIGCEDWTRLSIDQRDNSSEPRDENTEPPAQEENASSPNPGAPDANPPASGFELPNVRWLHTDVQSWPVTTTLHARISGGSIILEYDKARVWPGRDLPEGSNLNANVWIFVNRDGVWYGATWEWLRVGQTSKPITAVDGSHIKRSPLEGFRPVSGETYGFMVSGLARTSARNVQERSQVVMLTWP